jgi:hypothetical protein
VIHNILARVFKIVSDREKISISKKRVAAIKTVDRCMYIKAFLMDFIQKGVKNEKNVSAVKAKKSQCPRIQKKNGFKGRQKNSK